MKNLLLSVLTATLLLCFVVSVQAQQKRKSVRKKTTNKVEVVNNVEVGTNPFAQGATLPEEMENAWEELNVVQDKFKVVFPGKPLKSVIRDKFAKKPITRTNYILETKRGMYIVGYFPWATPKNDAILKQLYDTFTKDLLARDTPRIELLSSKEYSIDKIFGRDLLFEDTRNANSFRYRFIFANGKLYYISVIPSLELYSSDDRNLAEIYFSKFIDSFTILNSTEKQ